MKTLKTYKLFVEALVEPATKSTNQPTPKEAPKSTAKVDPNENIMKDMTDNDEIDPNKIENTKKAVEDIKGKIVKKKEELEIKLQNLENLEVETFTEENKKLVDQKKEQITKSIEVIKKDIEGYENTIKTFKDNIDQLKK